MSDFSLIGRAAPRRRKLGNQVKSEERVREYLLGLPDQLESATSLPWSKTSTSKTASKPTPDATESKLSTSITLSDITASKESTLASENKDISTFTTTDKSLLRTKSVNRGRRKSLTRVDSFISNGPPSRRGKFESKSGKEIEQTQDLSTVTSGDLNVLSDIRERSVDLADKSKSEEARNETIIEESAIDIKYKRQINAITQRIDNFNIEPFFSKWKISGFKYDKVLISNTENMTEQTETKEVTPEFVQYIKERDAARAEAKTALEELRETQCRLYDAMQEIDRLEKKVKSSKKNTAPKKKPTAQTQNLKVPSAASGSSSGVSSARTNTVNSVRTGLDGVYHPPLDGVEADVDTCEYYWKIGEMFPTLPMFYVLDAEKKFIKADLDYNGYIDKEELDKVLTDTVGMFTPNQVDIIFKEVDSNNSDMLDFSEVLTVLNKLYSRRHTKLPQSLQQNYSRTCVIQ